MKRNILFLIILLVSILMQAQDIVITKDAKKLNVKILEVSKSEIKYKEIDNLEGPTFILETSEIVSIIYSNGNVVVYNEETSPVPQVQSSMPEEVSGNKKYLFDKYPGLVEYLQGFPKKVVSLNGDYSMLYDRNTAVFLQINWSDSILVVNYEYNEQRLFPTGMYMASYRQSNPDFQLYDLKDFDINGYIKKACNKFNKSLAKSETCKMFPYSDYDLSVNDKYKNVYILIFDITEIDLGNGTASTFAINSGSTAGGVVLSGKITITNMEEDLPAATLYVDRVKAAGSPYFQVRLENTLNKLFGEYLFHIKKYKKQ